MKNTVVEGYINMPIKILIENISKEEFDNLDEKSKQKLIWESNLTKRGYYTHGVDIIYTHDKDEYGEF